MTSGELARALHTAVAHHEQRPGATTGPDRLVRVAISVRIAAAHLDAGNLIEARLALESAHHALPHRDRHAAEAAQAHDDARAVSETQQRGLHGHAVLAQAAGVLAEHTGDSVDHARTALHRHAKRHHFVLSELACDVVAGRVAPSTVVAAPSSQASASRRLHLDPDKPLEATSRT